MTPAVRNLLSHKRQLVNRIFRWFDNRPRDLPWLTNKSPYRIWVSEIMLQQTQIATVIEYYRRFMRRFPDVRRLATADVDDVLKHWEGLGYYRRARQLHLAAWQIVSEHQGKFPTDFEQVLALPGIGRYTASAILSIALDQRLPILEGNTIRLFARLMMLQQDTTKSQSQQLLWQFSDALLPARRPGDFNQALMDFGRDVCTPRNPDCGTCPLADYCPTFVRSLQSEIPNRGNKMQYEDLHEAIVLIKRANKFLMRKCAEDERWAGLWDFPRTRFRTQNHAAEIETAIRSNTGLLIQAKSLDKTIKHAVTKFRIRLDCYDSTGISGRLRTHCGYQWKTTRQIQQLPLNVTGRKFAKLFVSKS